VSYGTSGASDNHTTLGHAVVTQWIECNASNVEAEGSNPSNRAKVP
jgi:hypothetical protein